MGTRFEVYDNGDPLLHKVFRTKEEALNCVCDEMAKVLHRGIERVRQITYREIQVPDLRFICRGCKKEFFQDVDLTRVGVCAVCPFCHGHYYANACLPETYEKEKRSQDNLRKEPSAIDIERLHQIAKMRAADKRQWEMMSFGDRQQAIEDMHVTGNYWGPLHVGHEYWLNGYQ